MKASFIIKYAIMADNSFYMINSYGLIYCLLKHSYIVYYHIFLNFILNLTIQFTIHDYQISIHHISYDVTTMLQPFDRPFLTTDQKYTIGLRQQTIAILRVLKAN